MSPWLPALVVGTSLLLSGCGAAKDSTEKQLADMRASLVKLRSEHVALLERFEAVEAHRVGVDRAPSSRASSSAAGGGGPNLAVVRLAPPGADADEADDPAARTVIRANGKAISVDEKARSLGPDKDYELAMELYNQRKTDKALDAFSSFLTRYPDHPRAEAITFARAEAYAGKGDHRRAIEQYEAVVKSWPGSAKAPDALLRVAQSYTRLGSKGESDDARKRLAAAYPASDAAKKLSIAGPAHDGGSRPQTPAHDGGSRPQTPGVNR